MNIEVILMTYNRPYHTKKVLEGIKSEGFKKLKIYLDKAISKNDLVKQKKIKSIVNSIDWAECVLIEREESLGLAKSITSAISETLLENDAVIVIEDDCVPQTGFKRFMEETLITFKNQKKVRSICGYTYPCFNPNLISEDILYLDRFCPWGWATWKDRWQEFNYNLETIISQINNYELSIKDLDKDIDAYLSDERFVKSNMDIWSLNWILVHYLTETLTIYPKHSLVENIGFDGSGIHSSNSKIFNVTINGQFSIDYSKIVSNKIYINKEVNNKIKRFLEINSKMTMELNKISKGRF